MVSWCFAGTDARIAAGGGQALEVEADVADESSVQRMFDTVMEAFGPLQSRRFGEPANHASRVRYRP
jgi:NAD(P)-dependent dehydrogenase (short-subunit alcohol dehydrogenase family)